MIDRRHMGILCASGLAMLFAVPSLSASQELSDSLVAQLRAGSVRLALPGDSAVTPLVGSPTLPSVTVTLNGQGPYRFLIDLGSNVVLVRRSIVDAVGGVVLVDRAASDIVRIDSLQLGSARYEGVVAGAYDTLDVDGVLGYNLLQASSFTLDYPGKRLVLHRRSLAAPDNAAIFSYRLIGRMPYVALQIGGDSLEVNLDTGAAEHMTVPVALKDRLRWAGPLKAGPSVTNNQTGETRVLRGRLRDTPTLGTLSLPVEEVYVNPDADDPWLGSATLQHAAWTFDPQNLRLQVRMAPRKP